MPIHGARLRSQPRWRAIVAVLTLSLATCTGAARADTPLPVFGGPGGGAFDARCLAGQLLWGFELRTADDVDAIRPVCATAVHMDQITGDTVGEIWHGGEGGMPRRITCPLARPAVLGLSVRAEGIDTFIVNDIHLFCGLISDQPQALEATPSAGFDGPPAISKGLEHFVGEGAEQTQRCPPGQVAVGLRGRSGLFLDAVGLICDVSPVSAVTVHSIGRVSTTGVPVPKLNPCQAAALAKSKGQTIAATALEARCLASFKH